MAGVLALCGAPVAAEAATGHAFQSRIAESTPGEPLVEPASLAFDKASGRIFAAESGAGRVDVFSASGAFLTSFGEGLEPAGVAVDEASGYVYVAESLIGVIDVYRPDGSGGYELLSEWTGKGVPGGQFGEVRGVAVDNSTGVSAGHVYVVDGADDAVYVFEPKPPGSEEAKEGSYLRSLGGPKLEEPNAAVVSAATGDVYVADSAKGVVDVYSPTGAFETKISGAGSPQGSFRGKEGEEGNVTALAVEEATGNVYVAEGERRSVAEFGSTGEWLGWITGTPSGALAEPAGVAVDAAGEVFVSDAGAGAIDRFAAGATVPDVKTGAASKVGKASVTLSGTVDGEGAPASYHFEYGPDEAYGSVTPTVSAGSGEDKVKVTVTKLQAGSQYHYRLVAEDEHGANVGVDREFTTLPAVEALSTGAAEGVTTTSAKLTGTLTPGGVDTHYFFQWGTSGSYGDSSPEPPGTDAGSGSSPVAASTELSGLKPNTTYHYRLAGEDEYGTTYGSDEKLTTSGPPRITNEPVSALGHEAATLNAKVDADKLETEYSFQYGQTTGYGSEAGAGKLAAGETQVAVGAALTGLKIGTTYHYRVVASNSAGTTVGADRTFTTVPPALIEETSAAGVGAEEATVDAQVDPLGKDTTDYLQYGTEPCSGSSGSCADVPSPPGKDIGAGEAPVPVSQALAGLQPATTYHYRWIAINALGTAEGPEHSFTTQQAESPFALPDGRAWEMVSPPNKHGAPIEALTREGGMILAAEDGDSLAYVSNGSIVEEPQGQRSPEMQQVIATRTPSGWASQDVATPNERPEGADVGAAPEYEFFTPDLSRALVEPWGSTPLSEPPLAPGARQKTIYVRDDEDASFLPLVTEGNVAPGTEFGLHIHFLTATPDLEHVLLRSEVPLTGPTSGKGLYEWTGGELELVSQLPNGTPAPSYELGYANHVLYHAVSSDGTRVIWTEKQENTGAGKLYLRDITTGQTIRLDAAQGVAEPERQSAEFQAADAGDSRIFFTDKQRLTPESTSEPGGYPGEADLYECEIVEEGAGPKCDLHDLTVDENEGEHAGVAGLVLGAGEDGTSLYIVAKGVLATNENGDGESAEGGQPNLYELRFGEGHWSTTFIARLSSEDAPEWEGNDGKSNTAFVSARVSPDGRYLAFMSAASLTGYDNIDQKSGKRDEEVYLYDSGSGSLTCVSCNPTGERPQGVYDTEEAGEGLGLVVDRREIWVGHWLAGNIPGWSAESLQNALFQPRYLSDEGRLFFNSPDDLVPQAKNHEEDVYEYEPSGLGSCQSPTGGCVALISSGTAQRESAFLEATPNGDDVFFLTAARLLPQDTDTAFDVYDARVCTAESPCLSEPAPREGQCGSTSSCRPSEPAQPAPGGPSGTATFSGPGSPLPPVPQPRQGELGQKVAVAPKPKPLTREQLLERALKVCKKLKSHKKRKSCEAQARRRYGVKSKKSARKAARRRRP